MTSTASATTTPLAVPARGAADRRFEVIALAMYAIVIVLVSAFHEPWKDETQTWRLAIDSDGIAALARNARYEGHPLLFHILLQAIGHLSRAWWAAVAVHVIIACAAAWVLLRYSPFSRLEKALLLAGNCFLYEYAVIVRPYGLGMLLAFASCAAWTAERRRPALVVALLVLLANTSALGFLLALTAGGAYAIDWFVGADARWHMTGRRAAIAALCLAVAAGTVWLVVRQVTPPADAAYRGEGAAEAAGVSLWNIASSLTIPLRAFVPIDRIDEGTVLWNNWILNPQTRVMLAVLVLLSLAMIVVGCLVAMRRLAALALYLVGTLGFVSFLYLFLFGYTRHHGHLVIVWIMAAWLARVGPATPWPSMMGSLAARAQRWAPRLFVVSLLPMIVGAAEHVIGDLARPFSDARQVAAFLRARSLGDAPLIAVSRSDAQTVGALLDRPVLYPSDGRTGTFAVWGNSKANNVTSAEIRQAEDSLLARGCQVVLLATMDRDLPADLVPTARLIYETRTRPMSGNRYHVWLKSATPSARCPAPSPI
jgi:hypothetical protein